MDKAMQGEGNGIFHQQKRVIAAAAEPFGGNPNLLDRGAHGETTGVSGSPWKDRLEEVIENCVRAIKNLATSVGHQNLATSVGHRIRPRLAPPGVYFTRLYLSVPTPFGITGIRAGTRVVCVKDNGAVFLVKTGDLEFGAKREYLTNNLDIADLASRNDADAQQAIASSITQQQAMDQARKDEENAAFYQRQQEIAAERAAAAEAPGYSNPLDRGAYGETTGVSGPPSVGQIILPQSTLTQSPNLTVSKPAPTP